MSKSLSRLLYLPGLLIGLIGLLVLAHGYAGGTILPDGTVRPVHAMSAVIGTIMLIAASIMTFAAWVGALIRVAQLRRWGWFISLLIFSGLAMLLYIFFGPTTTPYSSMPATPPYRGFGD